MKYKKGFGFIGFLMLAMMIIVFVAAYPMIKGIIDPYLLTESSPLMKFMVVSLPAIAFFFIVFKGLTSGE